MPTLILPPRHTEDTVALWRAALASGWSTERLASFRAELSVGLAPSDCAIYGEPFFASTIAAKLGISLLTPPDDWLTSLPFEFLNRRVRHMSLGEARLQKLPAFIKPADEKCFSAAVYTSVDDLPVPGELDDSVPCLVSDPVVWESEFRCFVLDGHVVTASVYSRFGKLAQSADGDWIADDGEIAQVISLTERVAGFSGNVLPRSVVIDVGWISGAGWSIVEANAAWGSGIYGCDPGDVLRAVAAACVVSGT